MDSNDSHMVTGVSRARPSLRRGDLVLVPAGALLLVGLNATVRDDLDKDVDELTEGQELGSVPNQAECRGIPEGGGAAVAEDHLVSLGEGEQFAQPLAQPAHLRLHGLLAV